MLKKKYNKEVVDKRSCNRGLAKVVPYPVFPTPYIVKYLISNHGICRVRFFIMVEERCVWFEALEQYPKSLLYSSFQRSDCECEGEYRRIWTNIREYKRKSVSVC